MTLLICGLGSIGRRHLRNLLALGERDIVLYRTGKSTLPESELEEFPTETVLAEALDRWDPEAVLITNPTSLHLGTALAAARYGAHLFIEKPIAHSMDGVDELEAEVHQRDLKVLVGYQFRFHPGMEKAKELIETGAIGRLYSASAYWGEFLPDWHPWEDYRQSYSARQDLGGGAVLTLSHPIDYLRWLIGEVTEVSAETARPGSLEIGTESLANLCLTHSNGAMSHIHLNYLQRPPRHELEIIGEKGTIRWNNADGNLSWWTVEQNSWQTLKPSDDFERNTMFVAEMSHFIDQIHAAKQSRCSLQDGRQALAIALAALESARTGKVQPVSQKAKA